MGCMGDSLVLLGHAGGVVAYAGPVGMEIPTRFGVVMSEKMYTVKVDLADKARLVDSLLDRAGMFARGGLPLTASAYRGLADQIRNAPADPTDSRVVRLCDAFETWGADAIVERADDLPLSAAWQTLDDSSVLSLHNGEVLITDGRPASYAPVRLVTRLSPDYSVAAGPVSVAGSLREAYELWGPCVVRDSVSSLDIEISPDGTSCCYPAVNGSATRLEDYDYWEPFTLVEQFSRDYTIFRERVTREAQSFAADGRAR